MRAAFPPDRPGAIVRNVRRVNHFRSPRPRLMTTHLLLSLLLVQTPAARPANQAPVAPTPPPSAALPRPIARVEVKPTDYALKVGDTVRLAAVAYDSAGQPMSGIRLHWFAS